MTQEATTPESMIQKLGSLVLFAADYPQTVDALRYLKDCWGDFEIILFAFAHMRSTAVPFGAVEDCLAVWSCFFEASNLDAYMTEHILPKLNVLPFNEKILLSSAFRDFFNECVQHDVLTDRSSPESAMSGDTCRKLGCVCMLVSNSNINIDTVVCADLGHIWQTRTLLLTEQQSNKRHRGDTEDNETQSFFL